MTTWLILKGIVVDPLCHRTINTDPKVRKLSWSRVLMLIIVPATIGVILALSVPQVIVNSKSEFVAVFSVLAAVLLAMLPMIQSGLGITDVNTPFTFGQIGVYDRIVRRWEVLRKLYSEITFTVFFVVISHVGILLLGNSFVPSLLDFFLTTGVYAVSVLLLITSISIITRVYLILIDQADTVRDTLLNNSPEVTDRNAKAKSLKIPPPSLPQSV